MYEAENKDGKFKKPSNFNKKLNGILHDGPVSFNAEGDQLVFTKNAAAKKSTEEVGIEIWFSNFRDGKWSNPTPFTLNSNSYSVGHPFLTPNGKTLYFTSDMPGGFGGADIYKVNKTTDGSWSPAINLGTSVNTESDEMFPFYDVKNEQLYFSSNGHCGLGGLDIFTCQSHGDKLGRAYNLGYPLNTQYDDFSSVSNDNMHSGYLSSNRNGGQGGDDLYSFDVLKPMPIGKKLLGKVVDVSHAPIADAKVNLEDDHNTQLDAMPTDAAGDFCFLVDGNTNFMVSAEKEGYLDGKVAANSFSKEVRIKVEIVLNSSDTATKEEKELEEVTSLNPIYFDVDKYNIRPDAKPGLDRVVDFLNGNPAVGLELFAYTDCRESKYYNQVLSDKRANAVVNYLKKRTNKPGRIIGKGYGESHLVTDCACEGTAHSNCSESEHQKNRRTEFRIKE